MFMRDALYAGRQPLMNPTVAATNNEVNIVGTVTRMPAGIPIARGEWVNHCIAPVAASTPNIPPATDKATAEGWSRRLWAGDAALWTGDDEANHEEEEADEVRVHDGLAVRMPDDCQADQPDEPGGEWQQSPGAECRRRDPPAHPERRDEHASKRDAGCDRRCDRHSDRDEHHPRG